MSSCGSVPAGSSPRRMARSAIGAASLCRSAKRSRLIAASWSELGAPENSAREAIVPGDPVQASFETGNIQHLMFGIAGIAGNAQPGTAGRGLPSVPPRRHRRYACCSGRHPRLLRPARHRGDPRPGTWALRGRQAAPDDPHDDRLAPRSAGHQLAHGQARGIPGALRAFDLRVRGLCLGGISPILRP